MNNFIFENSTKVYFGIGYVKEFLAGNLNAYGNNVMLAYGGESIKKNGVYDEIREILTAEGKKYYRIFRHYVQSDLQKGVGGCDACKRKPY